MYENPQTITLDWLSLYCIGTIKDTMDFIFIKLEYSTRQFKDVHNIYFRKNLIGVATSNPTSKIINPKAIIVKFENKLLYSKSARYFIEKFLRTTKLFFKSITRADIARDFHRFINELHPRDFIEKFLSGTYLKNGRGKFKTIGSQQQKNEYEYLSFGNLASGKKIYLYNKSKELKEVKMKDHIVQFWNKNGLDTGADVWRLEFSFKGSQNKIVDILTGLISKISWIDLFSIDKLGKILNAAIDQFFSFKINDGTKNKTRMKYLILFKMIDSGIKLMKLPDKEDNVKPIKIMLKNLVKEFDRTPDTEYKKKFSIHYSILEIAKTNFLLSYLNHFIGFNVEVLPNPFQNDFSNYQSELNI